MEHPGRVGIRWSLLQKHCLFMPVLCMSNMPLPQQMALRGTRSHHAGYCSNALISLFRICRSYFFPGATAQRRFLTEIFIGLKCQKSTSASRNIFT
jgi:hypothetical protein